MLPNFVQILAIFIGSKVDVFETLLVETNQFIKVPSTGKIKSIEMLHKRHLHTFDIFDLFKNFV